MTSMDWLVVAGAAGAVAWVNWYFFFAERSRSAAVATTLAPGAAQQMTVTVDGGYSPATVRVKARQPLRLTFDRKDTSGCSEEVVFPDFGIRRYLPSGQRTAIDLTPPAAGTYEFMCGMSMLRGRIIAER